MIPPTVTHSPSRRSASSASEQSTRARSALADRLERVRGDEQADRLLLDRQQLALVELLRRDRRVRRARTRDARRRRLARRAVAARSKIEPWPICASCWACWPGALRLLEHREHALARVAPVEPNAPHLISASIAFLLTVRASTRSQKSHSDVERAALLARAP